MIFKQGMIVVITNGRLAGKKAVVMNVFDDGMLFVAGINRVPQEVSPYEASWVKTKYSKFMTFVKKIAMIHVVATRYKVDIQLPVELGKKAVEEPECKQEVNDQINKILKSAYESQKSKWLFRPIKF